MYDRLLQNKINADFKKQYYACLLFILLLIVLVYFIALKPTFVLRHKYITIEREFDDLQKNPNEVARLKSKIATYSKQNSVNSALRNSNELVAEYCNQNQLKVSYPNPFLHQKGNFIIETNVYDVVGDFHNITQLAYYIEQTAKLGKIASLQYDMKKNFETRTGYLHATIYLQSIKNIPNEK